MLDEIGLPQSWDEKNRSGRGAGVRGFRVQASALGVQSLGGVQGLGVQGLGLDLGRRVLGLLLHTLTICTDVPAEGLVLMVEILLTCKLSCSLPRPQNGAKLCKESPSSTYHEGLVDAVAGDTSPAFTRTFARVQGV